MASRRQIIGGLVSVLLHGSLFAWVATREPAHEPAEPALVMVERIEVASITEGPLASRAMQGSPGEDAAIPEPAHGDGVPARPEPEPEPEPPAIEPSPPPRPKPPAKPAPAPAESEPLPSEPATDPAPPEPPATDDPTPPESPASSTADDLAGRARTAGTSEGHGTFGSSIARTGTGESPDHSAYGAELVRLVKVEIDTDPVPGIWPHDSVEVELEVLPSGRLARHGLGKYDYARVVRSTLGPIRLRALLRRILEASHGFPPHPESFPRKRYVVGFTVTFPRRG